MSTVDLRIGGMTCASCATRVERKLNRLAGVRATVNFATETAHVSYPPEVVVASRKIDDTKRGECIEHRTRTDI